MLNNFIVHLVIMLFRTKIKIKEMLNTVMLIWDQLLVSYLFVYNEIFLNYLPKVLESS